MKSSNIIKKKKKNKNRQYLVKFYRGECLGSPHTGYGGVNTYQLLRLCNAYMFKSRIRGVSKKREVENRFYMSGSSPAAGEHMHDRDRAGSRDGVACT